MDDNRHMHYIEQIVAGDVDTLREKERTYGGSWKKRGGVGAFMMLARKWDRLENIVLGRKYDIFDAVSDGGLDGVDGSALAEIRDLRAYLILVESEMMARSALQPGTVAQDGGQAQDAMKKFKIHGSIVTAGAVEHPAPFGYTEGVD